MEETTLIIETKKNWSSIISLVIYGFFCLIPFLISPKNKEGIFSSIDFAGVKLPGFITFLIFFGLFIIGLVIFITLFEVIFLAKEKTLRFERNCRQVSVSDFPPTSDQDFNKTIFCSEVKEFFLKKQIKWSGRSRFLKEICYQNSKGQEEIFLDLTMPECAVSEGDQKKILDFLNNKN
jgi:hypothetical protein